MIGVFSTSFAMAMPTKYSTIIGTATRVCVIGSIDGVPLAMELQSDGKIVIVASSPASPTLMSLSRWNADGTPDTSFGAGGVVTEELGATSYLVAGALTLMGLAIASDGTILVRFTPDPATSEVHWTKCGILVSFSSIDSGSGRRWAIRWTSVPRAR